MSLFIPRVPAANRFNRDTFAAAWMLAYGGTWQNAVSAWRVDCLEALKRDLTQPFPSNNELVAIGLFARCDLPAN